MLVHFMEAFVIVIILFVLVKSYFNYSYKYWAKKGIPFIQPRFPLGNNNTYLPTDITLGTLTKEFYDSLKKNGNKFGGVYLTIQPSLVIVDPEYIKDILSTDFQYFVDRGFYYNEKDDPMSAHLFALNGTDWRNLRAKLTPTFTSGKMKTMFNLIVECCGYMRDFIDKNIDKDIDMNETLLRLGTDVIGSCAFGVDCNSFKYPDAEFPTMAKTHYVYSLKRSVTAYFIINFPELSLKLGLTTTHPDLRKFFKKLLAETIEMREQSNTKRQDFIQILLDIRKAANFNLDNMLAQVFIFFLAGFETGSTLVTYALYELARNENIQERLRQEVEDVLKKYDDKITYESLSEMRYLDQVIDETLRKYPPLLTLNRRCTADYTLRQTNIVIKKGTPILISPLGLHRDPELYPNPNVFDPERFSEVNKKSRHPFAYLPFGAGPRHCIASRFGIMQSKISLSSAIKNFKFGVSPKTKPVKLNPYVVALRNVNPVYLRAQRI